MKTLLKYFVSVFLFFHFSAQGQITADLVKEVLNSKIGSLKYPEQVKKFYNLLDYRIQWITDQKLSSRLGLFNLLRSSEQYGLNEKDYQFSLIESFRNGSPPIISAEDSIKTDILLSDAAIHFFSEIALGNAAPGIGYNGLDYKPEFFDVSQKLSEFVSKNNFQTALAAFEPKCSEYNVVKNKLRQLSEIKNKTDFREVVISFSKVGVSNLLLVTKFYQLGFLDSANKKITDEQLKLIIKKAQKQFGAKQDGVLSKFILNELNVSIATRIEELKLALNCLRWLEKAKQDQAIMVVNIPSATLLVYDHGKLVLDSKIIVGKPTTPTPSFTSRLSEVILYPYWMVPNKIAVKELLPSIKNNVGFLDANNYQVLNRSGKAVNPYKIEWSSLSSSNFPYIIRQSTGCDNSLGIVKLNFYSPYGVFLHDTPGKTLFNYARRYFSHGCMRVEKAIELAHLVLKGNEIAIDTLEEKGCLQHQYPVIVPANNQMALFVLYNTAWFDSDMNIIFSEDIYKKYKSAFKKN